MAYAILAAAALQPGKFINEFCDATSFKGDFANWLGGLTPCFADVAVLGSAHLVAIIALSVRLTYVLSARTDRYKLQKGSWWMTLLQTMSAAACLLIALFILNGRLATSDAALIPSRRTRGVAPFEWVGLGLEIASWLLFSFTLGLELSGSYTPKRSWLRRFPVVFIFAGELAKLRIVLQLHRTRGYFWWLYVAYCCFEGLLALLALLYFPPRDSLLLWSERDDGYLPLTAEAVEDTAESRSNPEAGANLWGRFTFSWLSPLMKLGYKRPLMLEDIFELAKADQVQTVSRDFDRHWKAQLAKRVLEGSPRWKAHLCGQWGTSS